MEPMNTVLMVTAVAGTIVGNAYFKDMDDCLAARAQVINQPDVTASCIITHQKPDNSAAMMKMFSEVLSKVATAQEQAQQ